MSESSPAATDWFIYLRTSTRLSQIQFHDQTPFSDQTEASLFPHLGRRKLNLESYILTWQQDVTM